MSKFSNETTTPDPVSVINLAEAPGEREAWGRPPLVVYVWAAVELLVIYNPWQISSALRVAVLRAFGASIGKEVLIRPRVRIKFPWNLSVGDRCWIGEGAWIHNQDKVTIGSDVVISQEVFITTGSHAISADMALITRPVSVEDGVWLSTRSMILGGVTVGRSAVVSPNTVVPPNMRVGENDVLGLTTPKVTRKRFQ
ncbi:DapH/DapD/GlmU-related protein [Arthrobacter burdickii]|uniref:DapH/DapD/GlmU-related protein n=1 Tax=Arthrobacter burdickii TaxID=3035920 RepID=A0ABT8K542_9MICC|nr:DapH/DapD/GlmU-related protein [Arthrobacter burdickii]MDN4612580.1 DapH/DapD/GlmU-related protein [Arthrobacter burdickii]